MDPRKRFILFGALAMGALAAPASSALAQSAEEVACFAALEANTIPALEAFLRSYPPSDQPTACQALALEALGQFTPSDQFTESREVVRGGLYGG